MWYDTGGRDFVTKKKHYCSAADDGEKFVLQRKAESGGRTSIFPGKAGEFAILTVTLSPFSSSMPGLGLVTDSKNLLYEGRAAKSRNFFGQSRCSKGSTDARVVPLRGQPPEAR
jgi:hypothetical protein